ncbi:MAG: fused response regulator/phosphatase [Proteobacteria bacterium]|nr:fused response regulator/phosphatase [Pseudomonadota bacterium]
MSEALARLRDDVPPSVTINPELAGARILVVDDSATVRKMIVLYLKRCGFSAIAEAKNGVEACGAIEQQLPDLIVTDISMPEMDGLELIRRVRCNPQWATIPILVETGSTAHEDRGRIFAVGATDLISKPIDPREMLGRIKVHLEQQHLVRKLYEYQYAMAADIELAREMQESLMPTREEIAAIEEKYGLDIATSYKASAGLGGDLWTLSATDPGGVLLWMVDFAGHGISAALNTFRFQALIRSERQNTRQLSEAMAALNEQLTTLLPVGQFATVLGLRILFDENCIEVVSAAAPPLVLRSGRTGYFQAIEAPGLPVGFVRGATYSLARYPFPPGSALLAYSDALVETPFPPESRFTPESLARALDRLGPTAGASEIQARLLKMLFPYTPQDDLTTIMICDRRDEQ